ncbi:activating signal cointegrator 1 complex subunit 2 [Neodiprion fabricii]|uniref:activating signal cointegrator 1 complex subunit 2 n=1 Tax=Neodiprion fabricii TaxID=2872261 RepID=UPI001ED8DCBF|nr:activating signal cointegrator 1 complex subunit 2 [Neodiprion fabricii]XP_046409694.1 activating signal cointegrator 1 complex subunit 2 [Neodiprion fabricii]
MSDNVASKAMDCFQNPELKPLEELKFKITNDGITREVAALSENWVEKRYYLHYVMPEIYTGDGIEIMGAKEEWLELVNHIIQDLKWLLCLPHHKFWSHIIYEPFITNILVSVLQESPPFYALENFPDVPEMKDAVNLLQQLVLLTFVRLVTNRENSENYMDPVVQGKLLYDNYIFTIAIIWDLCQLYGRENRKTVEHVIHTLFKIQPLYEDDLEKSIPFLIQVFRGIEQRFEDCPVPFSGEVVSLCERGGASGDITLSILEDHVIHLLDVSSSLAIVLEIYPAGARIFHKRDFMNRIIMVYENIVPEMYKRLEQLAYTEETMEKYFEIEHRLDVTRVEMLKLYRSIIFISINDILEKTNELTEVEIKEHVDRYLGVLLDALAEKEFINDYHQMYPIDVDLDVLAHICPEVDAMKCDFILQSLYASLSDTSQITRIADKSKSKPSVRLENNFENAFNNMPSTSQSQPEETLNTNKTTVELASLITKVKDILPHLGEGYIEKCLRHYNNDSESVVNAVLEDSLPSDIKELDPTLPYIPPDPMEASVAVDLATGMERLNVFDNDEFDVMTRDHIDASKVHKGKRKDKHKNLNELLNDKSYKEELHSVYSKYSLITDDYEDEYDDTYESQDVGLSARDEATEMDARPFTVPRVLQTRSKYESPSDDDEDEQDQNAKTSTNSDRTQFVQDPAVLRAKAEERRLSKRGDHIRKPTRAQEKDVVGKPKGQGQDKKVVINRENKNTHKSSRANHNRRTGAQWKRNQGMVPS